jgi:hypothetical protein
MSDAKGEKKPPAPKKTEKTTTPSKKTLTIAAFPKLVEVGRVVLLKAGKQKGSIASVVDIIDARRVIKRFHARKFFTTKIDSFRFPLDDLQLFSTKFGFVFLLSFNLVELLAYSQPLLLPKWFQRSSVLGSLLRH